MFGVFQGGEARAYPLRIMNWHEMANDVVVGVPHATSAGVSGAGVVDIHFPHSTTGVSTQRFGEDHFGITPTAHDNFGASVAETQFGFPMTCADLVIGAPGANGGAGSVIIGQGSNAGIKSTDDFQIAGRSPGVSTRRAARSTSWPTRARWTSSPARLISSLPVPWRARR